MSRQCITAMMLLYYFSLPHQRKLKIMGCNKTVCLLLYKLLLLCLAAKAARPLLHITSKGALSPGHVESWVLERQGCYKNNNKYSPGGRKVR